MIKPNLSVYCQINIQLKNIFILLVLEKDSVKTFHYLFVNYFNFMLSFCKNVRYTAKNNVISVPQYLSHLDTFRATIENIGYLKNFLKFC